MHANDLRDVARYILRGHGHHPSDVAWLTDGQLIAELDALELEGPHADLAEAATACLEQLPA